MSVRSNSEFPVPMVRTALSNTATKKLLQNYHKILENDSPETKLSPPSKKRRRRSLTSPLLSPLSTSSSPSLLFHPSQSVWDVSSLPRYNLLSLSISLSLLLPTISVLILHYQWSDSVWAKDKCDWVRSGHHGSWHFKQAWVVSG